jgi:hypothetical protein
MHLCHARPLRRQDHAQERRKKARQNDAPRHEKTYQKAQEKVTIHTFQGYPTYVEVDAETGRTAVTFDFKTPGEAPLFAGFMGNIFNGVEVLVEIEEDIEEDPDDD